MSINGWFETLIIAMHISYTCNSRWTRVKVKKRGFCVKTSDDRATDEKQTWKNRMLASKQKLPFTTKLSVCFCKIFVWKQKILKLMKKEVVFLSATGNTNTVQQY